MDGRRKDEQSSGPAGRGAMPDNDALRRRIAEKAYGLYLGRDRAPGHDLEDWLQAERLVRDEMSAVVPRSKSRRRAPPAL